MKKKESKQEKLPKTPENRLIDIEIERLMEEDPDMARKFQSLYSELVSQRNETDDARKSEKDAWAQNNSMRTELGAKTKEAETLNTTLTRLQSMHDKTNREYHSLKLRLDSAELKSALAESAYLELQVTLQRLHAQLGEAYTSIPERVRKELTSTMEVLTSSVDSMITSLKGTLPVQQPAAVVVQPQPTGKKE